LQPDNKREKESFIKIIEKITKRKEREDEAGGLSVLSVTPP
jgi:predicted CopG family antitoxin